MTYGIGANESYQSRFWSLLAQVMDAIDNIAVPQTKLGAIA
jgi:hypothetical protein